MKKEASLIHNNVVCDQYSLNNRWILAAEKNFDRSFLQKSFSKLSFQYLKQIHGDSLVEISQPTEDVLLADALWTRKPNIFLGIETADCLPILISSPKFALAIHAGWKGIANQIVIKSLQEIQRIAHEDFSKCEVYIGPHIRVKSFEVHNDVMEQLRQSCPDPKDLSFIQRHKDIEKKYVDLSTIVRHQLHFCGVKPESITEDNRNTYDTPSLASYRRDRLNKNVGRNTFLIALKTTK